MYQNYHTQHYQAMKEERKKTNHPSLLLTKPSDALPTGYLFLFFLYEREKQFSSSLSFFKKEKKFAPVVKQSEKETQPGIPFLSHHILPQNNNHPTKE